MGEGHNSESWLRDWKAKMLVEWVPCIAGVVAAQSHPSPEVSRDSRRHNPVVPTTTSAIVIEVDEISSLEMSNLISLVHATIAGVVVAQRHLIHACSVT